MIQKPLIILQVLDKERQLEQAAEQISLQLLDLLSRLVFYIVLLNYAYDGPIELSVHRDAACILLHFVEDGLVVLFMVDANLCDQDAQDLREVGDVFWINDPQYFLEMLDQLTRVQVIVGNEIDYELVR